MFAPTAASRCPTVETPEVNRVGLAPIDRFLGAKQSPGPNYPNVHFALPLSESRLTGPSDLAAVQHTPGKRLLAGHGQWEASGRHRARCGRVNERSLN